MKKLNLRHFGLQKLRLSTNVLENTMPNSNLVGRDLINPDHCSRNDVKTLLWTAKCMKETRTTEKFLRGRHITFFLKRPNLSFQISFERAAQNLGAKFTTCFVPENTGDAVDCGRLLSSMTDAIVTHGVDQYQVKELADGAKIPIINASSDIYNQMKAFTDLHTLLENLGPLKRRCLAWVGPPTPLCNTLIYIAPKLKLNLKLFCICPNGNGKMSAVELDHGLSRCRGQSEIHQCASVEDAVYRADVIATAGHHVPEHRLTSKVLEEASLDWFLLHGLPRTGCESSDDVFRHKNNLTWQSSENQKFVAMALLLRVLKAYEPSCPEPNFDGPE